MPQTPATPPHGPRSLLSEADREQLLGLLREHYARGQLDLDEMSRRVGVVLAAAYSDEAMAAVTDLPLLGAAGPGEPAPAPAGRAGQGSGNVMRSGRSPAAGWVPTPERFRDPSTRAIMRVWVDPADLSRHYVPEAGG